MLRTCVYYSNRGLHFSEQWRNLCEFVVLYPPYIFHGFIYGVVPFVSRRMPRTTVRSYVYHHQAFFGNCRLQRGRFAYNTRVDMRQPGQKQLNSVFAGYFLFGRSRKNHVETAFFSRYHKISLHERHQASAIVISAQSVQAAILYDRRIRVAIPAGNGLNRIDVRVEQKSRKSIVEIRANRSHVVTHTQKRKAIFFDESGNFCRCRTLVTAY